eukprot:TRINITY_DN12327_c1_g4_i4.p1 TRINITY_DN12327_c1_g4~~TRINITY_DN12327_c1_g4_i4.p1  ORF type:complete len:512 (+),score=67.12 TRINITY_DN12327_c1_g4_i4:367-1902(+)
MPNLLLVSTVALGLAAAAAISALFSPTWIDTADVQSTRFARQWDTVGLWLHCRYDTQALTQTDATLRLDRGCVFYGRDGEADFFNDDWRAAAIVFAVGTGLAIVAITTAILGLTCCLTTSVLWLLLGLATASFGLLLTGVLLWADELGALNNSNTVAPLCRGSGSFDRGNCDLSWGAILAFEAVSFGLIGWILSLFTLCACRRDQDQSAKSNADKSRDYVTDDQDPNASPNEMPVLRLDSSPEDDYSVIHFGSDGSISSADNTSPASVSELDKLSEARVVAETQPYPPALPLDSALVPTPGRERQLWWDTFPAPADPSAPTSPLFVNPTANAHVVDNPKYLSPQSQSLDSGLPPSASTRAESDTRQPHTQPPATAGLMDADINTPDKSRQPMTTYDRIGGDAPIHLGQHDPMQRHLFTMPAKMDIDHTVPDTQQSAVTSGFAAMPPKAKQLIVRDTATASEVNKIANTSRQQVFAEDWQEAGSVTPYSSTSITPYSSVESLDQTPGSELVV